MRTPFMIAAFALLLPFYVSAQDEPVDMDMMQKIKTEALQHSQIPMIAHYLTDVSSPPFFTPPPGYFRAANWIVQTLKQWGLQKATLEPWGEFGKGWSTTTSYIALKTPYYQDRKSVV